MTLIIYKSVAALLIFLVSIGVAFYVLKKKNGQIEHIENMHLSEALASGIFLGAAFFQMLPDAIHILNRLYGNISYPIAEAVCVFGFLFLLFLERLSLVSRAFQSGYYSIPYILTFTLSVHALTEGAALGIGATYSEAIMLFIAILAHKGSETFALCISLLRHEIYAQRFIFILVFFALMTPLGIGLGTVVNEYAFARNGQLAAALFNSFAAGTFLYISTLHHVHFHKHQGDSRGMLEFASLVFGAVTMGIISLWT